MIDSAFPKPGSSARRATGRTAHSARGIISGSFGKRNRFELSYWNYATEFPW